MPPRKRLVFISHSGVDTWVAKQIAREISACGAVPFLDEADIEKGEIFEEEIRNFLNQADELLVLLTPWALQRPYIWSEVGVAWGRKLPIIGVLHGITAAELQLKPGIPVYLKADNLLEINDLELYFAQLKKRTRSRRQRIQVKQK
jgi:hypothetical protein